MVTLVSITHGHLGDNNMPNFRMFVLNCILDFLAFNLQYYIILALMKNAGLLVGY